MEKTFWIKPHNEEQAALDATNNTLSTMPMGAPLLRLPDGSYVRDVDGWYMVDGGSKMMGEMACGQGYIMAYQLRQPTPARSEAPQSPSPGTETPDGP
jgi:hypothetical protein